MPEALRLFIICEQTQWAALPVAGGIYDQRPDLLDQWMIIWEHKSREERLEGEKQKREAQRKGATRRR